VDFGVAEVKRFNPEGKRGKAGNKETATGRNYSRDAEGAEKGKRDPTLLSG
jgi:hypothetical protein